ncbi:MAG: type II secretion system inner membrane protein GspF [Porticoccaceae bacterium]|nr:type II secretion system inner membrane protein GspF [Porticoccaceae bacterium]
MAAFDYIALDQHGHKQRGIIEADSPRSARTLLRDKQLIPLDVFAAKEKSPTNGRVIVPGGLSINDTALFTRQLATLLQAGIPLESCLDAVARQAESQRVKRTLLALRSRIREGFSLADSLKDYPRTFSTLYRATVSAGERTGHLDLVLDKLADYTQSQQQFRQHIQLALIYPIILVILSLLIVTGLMMFVVPEILAVIIESGQALPLPTQLLVSFSGALTDYGLVIGFVLIVTFAAGRFLLRKPRIHFLWHRQLLNIWGLKRFSRGANAARYTSTLAILIESGIPLNEAMPIASEVCSNSVFRDATKKAQQKVQEGRSLNLALEETRLFPPMILQLITSGEQSGNLSGMLNRAAKSQESDLRQRVTTLVSLFEPMTLLMMGAMVLGIVLAVLLPILNLNQLVK